MHSISQTVAWYVMTRNRRRRRIAAAANAAPLIDMPEDFLANYNANMLSLDPGDEIDVWSDVSGNVNDAWQNSPEFCPTLQSVSFAGKTFRVARFDTYDDGMTTPISIAANATFSIFALWRPADLSIFCTALISSASLDWSMGTYQPNHAMLCYFNGFAALGTVNTSDFFLFEARITPGEQPHSIYLNGAPVTVFPNGGSSGPEQITFGASGANGYPAACDCAQILIYDRYLSDDEAAAVRAYFQSQYNYLKL